MTNSSNESTPAESDPSGSHIDSAASGNFELRKEADVASTGGEQVPRPANSPPVESRAAVSAMKMADQASDLMVTTDALRKLERLQVERFLAYKRSQLRRSVMLFALTFLSTFLVGANYMPFEYVLTKFSPQYEKFLQSSVGAENLTKIFDEAFQRGYQYAIPLMLILFCHEMGHYLQSVKYRVPASLPYFIPLPLPPMGTMGAVIFQGRGTATRKQMFDIAVSGPIAGLIVTMPILWYGIKTSRYEIRPDVVGLEFGEPLLVKWIIYALHGAEPAGNVFMLNSIGFAGWVGVLITALNMLPVGQLDGGHILYTLIGKPAHYVAYGVIGLAVSYMMFQNDFSFTLLLLLLLLTGPKHPPTANDKEPIGVTRHVIGWLTLSFLILGFTPNPIIVQSSGDAQQEQAPPRPTPDYASVDR